MAQTIPNTISSKWKGEQRVFALLKKLPDDVVVYYEPIIDNRLPDFVIILPEIGILLIEVKDWKLSTIMPGSNLQSVQLRIGEQEKTTPHPLRQVADYKIRLMDRCREDKHFSKLIHTSGPYAGCFKFPFGSFALLTNITREKLNSLPNSERVFPVETVATKDQFAVWAELPPQKLMEVLKGYFDPFWLIQKMTPNQVNIVKAILHPEILISSEFDFTDQQEEPTVKVLDLKQEGLARDVGEGHRLVFGVAGSGKTVLLIARAKLIARLDPKARVLVLCYNVVFGTYLAEALKDCSTVMVMTFHRWAGRNGVKWNDDNDDSQVGEELLIKLKAGALDSQRFDSILIDEAQDFDSSWYKCVLAAMKDPIYGDLLIVGDGSQGLYKRNKVSWKQLGIQASGRTQYLDQNYRNTRPIVALATRFANKSGDGDEDGLIAPSVDPNKCIRLTGSEAVLLTKQTKQAEVDRVVRVVGDLLDGQWFGDPIEPLMPHQIGIFYRMDHGIIHSLREKLKTSRPSCPVVWLTEKGKNAKGHIGDLGVKILTMHSSKGLQFKAVILLFADDCPADFSGTTEEKEEERCLFYVALTRAEDYLAISCSRKSKFIDEIQSAGVDTVPTHADL